MATIPLKVPDHRSPAPLCKGLGAVSKLGILMLSRALHYLDGSWGKILFTSVLGVCVRRGINHAQRLGPSALCIEDGGMPTSISLTKPTTSPAHPYERVKPEPPWP